MHDHHDRETPHVILGALFPHPDNSGFICRSRSQATSRSTRLQFSSYHCSFGGQEMGRGARRTLSYQSSVHEQRFSFDQKTDLSGRHPMAFGNQQERLDARPIKLRDSLSRGEPGRHQQRVCAVPHSRVFGLHDSHACGWILIPVLRPINEGTTPTTWKV